MIRNAKARLPQVVFADAGIVIEAHPQVQRQAAERDCVLSIDCCLFDVSVAVEGEEVTAARQIERQQPRQKALTCRVIEIRIGDSELEGLAQKCVRGLYA